jgi:cytochrome P450
MRDQVMTFLGAGHDTTATSAAWTLMMLAKNPEIQEKLRDELREMMPFLFDGNTRGDLSSLDSQGDVDLLPYLDDVCRESLRYIPSIPMTVRKTIEDDTLAGYFIPAGTTVYLMANAINRLPMYWGKTANKFDPSRWRNLPDTYTTNAFMTFLQGKTQRPSWIFSNHGRTPGMCRPQVRRGRDEDDSVLSAEQVQIRTG